MLIICPFFFFFPKAKSVYLTMFSHEDEVKGEDAQSMVSGGEEYEPISDDELDEILADSAQKREDQQDDERVPGTSMTLLVGGWKPTHKHGWSYI